MVYIIFRSQYEVPLGHRKVTFDDDNIFSWLANIRSSRTFKSNPEFFFNGRVYNLKRTLESLLSQGLPEDYNSLQIMLNKVKVNDGEVYASPGIIEGMFDDDEIEYAWYVFDTEYLAQNSSKLQFLLHESVAMPEKYGELGKELPVKSQVFPKASGDGTTYAIFISSLDGCTISDMTGVTCFKGCRLPEFANYLRGCEVGMTDDNYVYWPAELILMRALVLATSSNTFEETLNSIPEYDITLLTGTPRYFTDLRREEGNHKLLTQDSDDIVEILARLKNYSVERNSGVGSVWTYSNEPSFIQTSKHFSQIRFFRKNESVEFGSEVTTSSYLFFDDLWVEENYDLAQSMFDYAQTWRLSVNG